MFFRVYRYLELIGLELYGFDAVNRLEEMVAEGIVLLASFEFGF